MYKVGISKETMEKVKNNRWPIIYNNIPKEFEQLMFYSIPEDEKQMSKYCIPDDPIVTNMERTGYPDGKIPKKYICPICGADDIETIYTDSLGDILGCDECVYSADPWDVFDDQ